MVESIPPASASTSALSSEPLSQTSYVHLLTLLLSPPHTALPPSTPSLLSLHISSSSHTPQPPSEQTPVYRLTYAIITSPSLWSTTSIQRVREVFGAVVRGIRLRVDEIKETNGNGWGGRRVLNRVLDQVWSAVDDSLDESVGEDEKGKRALTALLVTSAVLRGLIALKEEKDRLYVGGRWLMGRGQDVVIRSLNRCLVGLGQDLQESDQDTMVWLSSQILSSMEDPKLKNLERLPLLDLLVSIISASFGEGRLFDHLDEDLIDAPEGLIWNIPSPSYTLLSNLYKSPLYPLLGPISRSVAKLITNISEYPTARAAAGAGEGGGNMEDVAKNLKRLERLAERVMDGWGRCKWSDVLGEEGLAPQTRQQTLPWTHLKTLIFTLTLIHSSTTSILTSSSTSLAFIPTSSSSTAQTNLSTSLISITLQTFSYTSFITSRFGVGGGKDSGGGGNGFGAYKGVWYGSLDVLCRVAERFGNEDQGEEMVKGVVERLEERSVDQASTGVEERAVPRARITYYFDVVEQVLHKLPDEYIEETVLVYAKPYLEDARYKETFESAHSVVLSIFAKEKKCGVDLAPWYTELLLKSHPQNMSASQLRLAFTTMIRSLSNFDDSVAWYCISRLISKIESTPVITPLSAAVDPSSSSSSMPRDELNLTASLASSSTDPSSSLDATKNDQRSAELDRILELDRQEQLSNPTTRLDESSSPSLIESKALSGLKERGHLILILIDQLTSVNLLLLETLLDRIKRFVEEEDRVVDEVRGGGTGSSSGGRRKKGDERSEGRDALVKVLFTTLGEGMDATKREAGTRWWMEHGKELTG